MTQLSGPGRNELPMEKVIKKDYSPPAKMDWNQVRSGSPQINHHMMIKMLQPNFPETGLSSGGLVAGGCMSSCSCSSCLQVSIIIFSTRQLCQRRQGRFIALGSVAQEGWLFPSCAMDSLPALLASYPCGPHVYLLHKTLLHLQVTCSRTLAIDFYHFIISSQLWQKFFFLAVH